VTQPKTNNDWRLQFSELIVDGPVEVRLILKGVLDNCLGHEVSVEDKYTEVCQSVEEFDSLLKDPTINKVTSLRIVPKSEFKKRGIL
jgi:hypothetical protein